MFKNLSSKLRVKQLRHAAGTVASGHIINSRLIRRNIVGIGIFMWLVLSMITVRYDCTTSMETINRKNEELAFVCSQKQSERSYYMSQTREITIRHKIDSLRMGLSIQSKPPYVLSHE